MHPCQECGMSVAAGEYHPYAACLMFVACHNGDVVRDNLDSVVAHGVLANSEAVSSNLPDELRQAAQAVVDRWDTPRWKDVPHTAEFIDRMRKSLAR